MRRAPVPDVFERVRTIGVTLPNVEAAIRYDGAPVLKLHGCFVAGLASHASAEPASLVVRVDLDQRASLLEDAPDAYYITDYYQPYPLVLVRLAQVDDDALRDLLSVSRQLTVPKTSKWRRTRPDSDRPGLWRTQV